jgi:hypothetical protein
MAIAAQHNRFVTNEYVNALPADDFIKVAMKKQEMFDEGRKQIKQNLDNYGKLRSTIVNENARNYFDQELNKLVKNVQENAGLDFSNLNNVEAVINLGKPFENDQYIKNALDNGLEYQRRAKELEGMDKSLRSADNDLVYMYDMNQYMEKGGLDTKVAKGKTYQQYIDVKDKVSKIEKDVQAQMQTIYRQGPAGYIEKVEIERKTQEEISRRIEASLSPEEQNQLQIHAQAQMYRLGPDVLYQTWVGANKQEKLMFDDTRKKAMYRKSELSALKNRTAEQTQELNDLDKIIQESDAVISAATQNANMNPDEFDMEEYLPFFSRRFINGIAANLTVEKVKSDLKKDEVFMTNLEHRNRMAQISATGREARLTAQFEFQQENFVPEMQATLYTLKNVMSTTVLPKDFKLDTKASKSEQINSLIAAISKNDKVADINKRRYIDNLTTLQKIYQSYESNPNSQDVIIFDKANGLGQTQTSVKDFLSAPITDIFKSGMTVDAMKYSPKGKTSDNSGQKKLKDLISEGVAGGLSEEEATKKAKEKLKAGLEVTTTGTGPSGYNPATTGSFNPSTSDTTRKG